MRAELSGKLSMSSPSRQDRLEDTLTDGVFSALNYLPREVLLGWLARVLPERWHGHLSAVAVDGARLDFWPKLPGGTEPDVVLRVGSLFVVVEAKYRSPFSRPGGRHQLVAEWRQAHRVTTAEGLEGPVVVAVTADLVEPADIPAARGELEAGQLETGSATAAEVIVWSPWQWVAEVVEDRAGDGWRPGERAVADDLFALMERRGVRYVYTGFNRADWWVLAAAAEAATERVYPTIAEFAREVVAQGGRRGLVWGGSDAGVVWYESKHPLRTDRWHRNYVQLPFLHESFGRRATNHCGLYVLFSFTDPRIRVGWWFEPREAEHFGQRADDVVAWLQGLDAAYGVVVDTPWRTTPVPVDRELVTADWMRRALSGGAWFRVERVWAPEELTSTAPAIDALDELAASLTVDGSVLAALAADGTLRPAEAAAHPSLDLLDAEDE